MTKYYDTIAETSYDGLIVNATPSAHAFGITLEADSTPRSLIRGMILLNEGDEAYAILTDDVEIPAGGSFNCTAYRTGHFARGRVVNEDGTPVTPEQEDSLRKYGILLSDAIEVE